MGKASVNRRSIFERERATELLAKSGKRLSKKAGLQYRVGKKQCFDAHTGDVRQRSWASEVIADQRSGKRRRRQSIRKKGQNNTLYGGQRERKKKVQNFRPMT